MANLSDTDERTRVPGVVIFLEEDTAKQIDDWQKAEPSRLRTEKRARAQLRKEKPEESIEEPTGIFHPDPHPRRSVLRIHRSAVQFIKDCIADTPGKVHNTWIMKFSFHNRPETHERAQGRRERLHSKYAGSSSSANFDSELSTYSWFSVGEFHLTRATPDGGIYRDPAIAYAPVDRGQERRSEDGSSWLSSENSVRSSIRPVFHASKATTRKSGGVPDVERVTTVTRYDICDYEERWIQVVNKREEQNLVVEARTETGHKKSFVHKTAYSLHWLVRTGTVGIAKEEIDVLSLNTPELESQETKSLLSRVKPQAWSRMGIAIVWLRQ